MRDCAIKFLVLGLTAFVFIGCKQSIHENQLVGSWKLENSVADARFTYYANHTWVMTIVSSDAQIPSGSEFGDWKLDGNRIITITRCTLDNIAGNTSEIGSIVKLTDSVLVEKTPDINGQTKTSTFHKIDAPAASVSDAELCRNLVGTWVFSYTNASKAAGVLLYSSYQPNGTAFWHGIIFKENQSLPMPEANGVWKVENGYLGTTITNSQSSQLAANKETRDQIISITDSQFTYRDEQDTIKKVVRLK